MATDALSVGESYLAAWARKDLQEIAKHLHPQIHFRGPMAEVTGREPFLASCERMLPLLKELKVRSKFAAGNQAIFTYDFICNEPVGVCPTAELMMFEDGLLKDVQLFFDPRPFERLASATKS